jgi:hypothetical protein
MDPPRDRFRRKIQLRHKQETGRIDRPDTPNNPKQETRQMKNLQDRIDQIEAKLSETTWEHREAVAKIYAEAVALQIEHRQIMHSVNDVTKQRIALVEMEHHTAEETEAKIVDILWELSCTPEAGEQEPEADLTKSRYSFDTGKYEAR